MTIQTTINNLQLLTNGFSYLNNGDIQEITNGHLVTNHFSNSEIFWKNFVTPMTNRCEPSISNPIERIKARTSISKDLEDLSIIHYSVFLNLVYAEHCLANKHMSYFENFYTHLGSVCDLAEEFITQLYFITLECEEKQTEVLQRLSKAKFLDLARDWYDKYYPSSFEHYLSKGKTAPFKIIGRANILEEYFAKAKEWKEYSKVALQIRTYRNVVVHNTQIGTLIMPDGLYYVPKKNKIGDYKKWHQVFSVKQDRFQNDFIEKNKQMLEDFIALKTTLNNLWPIPMQHFNRLLYIDKNKLLLAKYDITILENNGI